MPDPSHALAWMVEVLRRHRAPFQAVGGLAARAYGATRPLVDLDFYLPLRRVWPALLPEVGPYVTWGPEHYRDAHWDITFVKLTFAEQRIELGDSEDALFFDPVADEWVRQVIDYEASEWREVLGSRVPVMPRSELIRYKRRLNRPVDQQDLIEIAAAGAAADRPDAFVVGRSAPGAPASGRRPPPPGAVMLELDSTEYAVTRLGPADAPLLQSLYERCSDYHELEEGIPTRPDAAEHMLAALPPGKEPDDKCVLGVRGPEGRLLGVIDLIRDYPGEHDWWLGLLMLDPEVRGSGLGGRLYRSVEEAVVARGGRAIYLGVLEQNAAAERFWRRQGFEELRRQPYISVSGHRSRVIVLYRSLA